jgi:hypothetical protein
MKINRKIFCERHRPLKLFREIEDIRNNTADEILTFCKLIERCEEIQEKL